MTDPLTRRQWLSLGTAAACAGGLAPSARAGETQPGSVPAFRFALNTSTIRGQKLPLAREAELAAQAGYQGIEPWVQELEAHVKEGGTLESLGKQFRDLGLTVPSVIGFFEWCVDDEGRRRKALDEARRVMTLVRAVGGLRIAAPATGATQVSDIPPERLAARYRALLELGREFGVVPELEVWGHSKTLRTLGEAAHVAVAADHPDACILADVFHLYKGRSGFHGVRLLSGQALPVFHVNDVPAGFPRDTVKDSDRVYPGDGVAPLVPLFRDMRASGFHGFLSLELFNPAYYALDAADVLRTGLEKLKRVVEASEQPAGR